MQHKPKYQDHEYKAMLARIAAANPALFHNEPEPLPAPDPIIVHSYKLSRARESFPTFDDTFGGLEILAGGLA